MDRDDLTGVLAAFLFTLAVVCIAMAIGSAERAYGAECPPDRPNKRMAVRYPVTMTCTLLACSPRLKCDSERCWSVVEDCNKCTPQPVEEMICLSDEELARAK